MLKHKGTKEIRTARLLLRRAVMEDAQPMFENWASDPAVTKYLTWPAHENIDVTKWVLNSWIGGYQKDDFYQWMIVPQELGQPIGTISVVAQNSQIGKAEIGYCIGKKWWHQGIVSETLLAVIDFLFDEVGMNRVEARHDPRNPNSGSVMRKCGMQYEGTSRQADRNNLGICDTCYYGLLAEDRKR